MTTNKNPIFLSIALLLLLCVQGSAWAGGPANNVNIDETSPAAKAIVANPGSMDEFLIERLGSAPLPSWGKTFVKNAYETLTSTPLF